MGDAILNNGVNITHDAGNSYKSLADLKEENTDPTAADPTAPSFTEGTKSTGRGVEVDGGHFTMNGGKISDNNVVNTRVRSVAVSGSTTMVRSP